MMNERKKSKNERKVLQASFWWLWWVVKNNFVLSDLLELLDKNGWVQEEAIVPLSFCLFIIDFIYAEG